MSQIAQRSSDRLSLADLIDLEVQLERDRQREEQDRAALRERDAAIAQEIGAASLPGRELFLAWLRKVRPEGQSSPGEKAQTLLDGLASVLFMLGLFLGGGAVASWLLYDLRQPINVIFFWAALIGVQILLLAFWTILVLPAKWVAYIPGVRALQMLLRGIEAALPMATGWIASKISPEHRLLLAEIRGAYKRWDYLYGRIRLWLLIRLTQVFAVGYNLGAIAVFIGLTYGADPAFGWKSRMMTAGQLHAAARVVALPWSWAIPEGVPSREDVAATVHSSLAPDFEPRRERATGAHDVWASWWPFLFGSLLTYGLIPRLSTLGVSSWQVRKQLAQTALNHSEFHKLRDRLLRPMVKTQAAMPDVDPKAPSLEAPVAVPSAEPLTVNETNYQAPAPLEAAPPARVATAATAAPACAVIRWAGVPLGADETARQTAERLGVRVVAVYPAGGLDVSDDETALRKAAESGAEEVVVLVESWEPPVGDYLDFLTRLRERLGRERMIRVVLYNRGANGAPAPPRSQDAQVWRRQLGAVGDPWLGVDDFVEEGAA